jgi:hypothetical protein
VIVASLALAPSAVAQDVIRPGDLHETDQGGCTLGFVFDGTGALAGRVFISTAAHCVQGASEQVRLEGGELLGEVALVGDQEATADDYALIAVRPELVSRVAAGMRGNETYPRGGYTTPAETDTADVVQLAGHGVGFDLTPVTREQRRGVLTADDEGTHQVLATLIFGDSGGPVTHLPTGKALGTVSRLCIGLCQSEGPTVQGIVAKAAARGFAVRLRTV